MNLISLLIALSLTFVGGSFCKAIANTKKSLLYSTTLLLGIAVLSYSNDITAFAAIDLDNVETDFIATQNQQQLQEDLRLTPDGGEQYPATSDINAWGDPRRHGLLNGRGLRSLRHYSGIEHAQPTTGELKAVNDDTIKQSIEAYTSNNVIVSVANGSVRLSGRVKDKELAQQIVKQALATPGVYEITFDLGLDNTAS